MREIARERERERIWRKKKAKEEEEEEVEENKKSNGFILICLSFHEERGACSGERSKRVWKWLWFSGCSRSFVAEVKMSRGGEICVNNV
jgi:L-fucose isomerase-like protein